MYLKGRWNDVIAFMAGIPFTEEQKILCHPMDAYCLPSKLSASESI